MKKKLLFVIIGLILSILTHAQKEINILNYFGMGYYNYNFKEFSANTTYYGLPLQKGNHQYESKMNWELGIGVEYKKNKMGSGIHLSYSAKDFNVDYDFKTPSLSSDSVFFNIDKTYLKFRYLDMQIPFSYYLLKTKKYYLEPKIYFGIGFFLNKYCEIATWEGNKFTENQTDIILQYKSNHLVCYGKFSFDMAYRATSRFSLFLSPYVSRYFIQVCPEPMNKMPMVFGLNIGIKVNVSGEKEE